MRSLVDLLTPPEGTCEIPRRAGIDLGSRELDTGASTRPRDFAWGEAEEPEPEPEPLTPDSFNKNTKAEPPTFLRPGLFIGSVSAERDLQVLRKYGITHVLQVGISLRPRHASSLVYAQMKCPDSRNFDVFHAMIQSGALQFVEQGRKAGGVLVHCAAGRSRSATVVAAHLMQDEHLSAEEAIEDIRQRWWICPNIGFRQQLELFHKLGGDLSCWPQPESSSWPKRMIRSRPVTPPPQRASVPPQTPPQTLAQSPQRRVQQLQPQPVQVLSPVQATTPANSPAKTAASAQPPPPLVQVLAPVLADQPVSKPLPAQKPVQPTRPVQPQTPVKAPAQPRKPHSAWMAFADLDGTYAIKPKLELSGFQTMSAPTSRGVSRDSSPAPRAAAAPPAVAAGDPRRPAGQRARGPSPEPGPRRSPHEARHSSPARASVTYRAVSAPRHSRPAADGPFKSVFVPPSMWRGQDGWDLRAALQSAGLSAERAPSDWGRRFSFSDSPQPPKAAVVRAY